MSYFKAIQQNVIADTGNSSNTNLAAGNSYTFTGTGHLTTGVNAIQITLKADKNATVVVEQSSDNSNWDVTDTFNYYTNQTFGVTVQAVGLYYRVVVTTASLTTTYFRLNAALCPIVEAVPRALSEEGNLKVGVYEIEDLDFLKRAIISPMRAQKTATATRLVGAAFIGSTLDANFWTASLTGTGAATVAGGMVTLSTGATANSTSKIQSVRYARYVGASPNYYRGVVRCPASTGTNLRRWGAYDANDGYYFHFDGTTFSIGYRKSGSDTLVSSGSFTNGRLGLTYTLDTNSHTFEIYWSNSSTWFFVDDNLLYKLTGATAPLTSTLTLAVTIECNNSGGNTNNNSIEVRSSTINRLGQLITQPISYYRSTTTTGVLLKSGAGNLHSVVVGAVPTSGSVVTIYDGTSTGGTIMASFTFTYPNGGNFNPASFDFQGVPFSTGLYLVVATQACAITCIYE